MSLKRPLPALWLIFFTQFFNGLAANELLIQSIPAKRTGEALYLTCYFPPSYSNMQWLDPEGVVYTSEMWNIDWSPEGVFSIYFPSVTLDSGGVYTCRGLNGSHNEAAQMSTTINVTIYDPLVFVDTPKIQIFTEGENAEVICHVEGNPPGYIKWQFSKDTSSGRIYEDEVTSNLIIKSLRRSDAANYQCTAREKTFGQFLKQAITVQVQFAPSQVSVPRIEYVVQGGNVTLKCNATAEPEPTYRWYRVSKLTNDETPMESQNWTVKDLLFENVQLSQAGRYACVASNVIGNLTNTTELFVMVPPSITKTTNNSVKIGSQATIQCSGNGLPIPTIDIYRKGDIIHNSSLNGSNVTVFRTEGNTTVVFDSASPEDAGEYNCVAKSGAGLDYKPIFLEVLHPPILVGKTPPTVQGCLNGEAEIPCKFNGNPKPSLKWGKLVEFDNPITGIVNVTTDETENVKEYIAIPPEINHAFRKGSDDSLILHLRQISSKSFDSFTCHASNSEGENMAHVALVQARLPKRIYELEAIDVSTRTVTISFTTSVVAFVPVTSYNITVINSRNYETDYILRSNKMSDQSVPFHQTMRIKRLKHHTEYFLTIAAINCRGQGEESKRIFFKTKRITKPEALVVTSPSSSHSSTNYTLTWEVHGNGGGSLKGIEIVVLELKDENPNEITAEFVKKSSPRFHKQFYPLSGLKPSTTYSATLALHNEVESTSTIFNFTTKTDDEQKADSSYIDFTEPTVPSSTAIADETTALFDKETKGFLFSRAMVIMLVVLVVIFFIVFDVSCCVSRRCGFLFSLQSLCCPNSSPSKNGKIDENSVEYKKNSKNEEEAIENDQIDNTTCSEKNSKNQNGQ